MKMLKRLLRFSNKSWFSRSPWGIRGKPQTVTQLYPALEPDEFARLLRSGRTEDLKILARKLSGPAKAKA
jgi:hypothetical protein